MYQTEISYDVYATANSRNMTNSGTASQILKHSTKILKKAWPGQTMMHVSAAVPKQANYNRTCGE